jgi:Leucine-rich repeat (LRR) protein
LLTTLNTSHLFALKYLHCSNNSLEILDVSGCTALTQLGCIGNSLSSLDVSGFTSVPYLNCNLDDLTAMPVTQCITSKEPLSVSNYELDVANVLSKQGGGYFQKLLGVQLELHHMCTVLPALQPTTHAFSNNALRSSLI